MSNEEDKFAVAFYQELGIDEKKIAGHLPVEFSKIAAYFIENGTQISCRVTVKRKHSVKEAFSNKRTHCYRENQDSLQIWTSCVTVRVLTKEQFEAKIKTPT